MIMRLSIIGIGNSKGVIIPAKVLKKLGVKDYLELEVRRDALLLRPKNPRSTWEVAFKKMASQGDDLRLIDDVFEDESFEEWK